MAQKRITKRRTVRRKSVKRVLKNDFIVVRPVFALLSVLIVLVLLLLSRLSIEKKSPVLATFENLSTLKPTASQSHIFSLLSPTASPSPTITPSPAVTDSPTPIVQEPVANDFCLNVPILVYHHTEPIASANAQGHGQLTVDAAIFDQQMAYLESQNYHTVSIEDIVHALMTHQQLPAKSIAVTLDDGYIDAYTYAYPISKKYNIQMNYMIATGLVGNNDYMTWSDLKEMNGNGLTHFYNHTWSHAGLGTIPQDKILYEVNTAQKQLAENLGPKAMIIIYPYGSYSPLAISLLEKEGYYAGVSTLPGTVQCQSFIMTLHRTHIGNAPLSAYGL